MLNIENIKKVRDFLANLPPKRKFDMTTWGDDQHGLSLEDATQLLDETSCGTAGCIAGWTCALLEPNTALNISRAPHVAGELLGLTETQASALFFAIPTEAEAEKWDRFWGDRHPDWPWLANITVEQAIATLDRLIETGEVRW